MSLEVIRIPEIIEYGTNFSSRWKCAWLPILWKIQSDLFPTNSVDVALIITSVANNGEGLAEFTCSANHLLSRLDWVNVISSTVTDYEGIEQIVEVSAANIFTLNIPFSATATGSAIKYYNNYHALIEVYGGLPSGHEFENQDPSLLTTTVKIFFDSNNIAVVDLSRIAQTLINNIFDNNIISWPNVLNFWDQTEILLKESFDQVQGVSIITKERYGCIKDGGFVTGADWTNEGTGADWTFGSDQANVSLDQAGDDDSKELTQTILGDALARFSITVTLKFTHTSGTPSVRLRAIIGGTIINVQGSTSSQATLIKTVTGLTTNDSGVFSLEADITAGSGTDTVDVVIDDVEVCIGLANRVVNSKLDFRNGRGGNMFDYIVRDDSTIAKWMTGFTQPTLFADEYFSLSIIIDGLTFDDIRLGIEQEDASGAEVADDLLIAIDDQDIGVYQLRIDQLGISPLAKAIKVSIIDTALVIVGNAWSEIITETVLDLTTVAVTSSTRIYIAGNDPSVPELKRSNNAGDTFTDKSQPSTGTNGVREVVGIGDEDRLYVAQVSGFGSTGDGLDSYNIDNNPGAGGPVNMHASFLPFSLIVSLGNIVVQNVNGGVRISNDGGATWAAPANSPPTNAGNYTDIFMISATNIITCGLDFKIFFTQGAGALPWSLRHTDTVSLRGLFMLNDFIGFCVGDEGRILKTTNQGSDWSPLTSGVNADLYAVYFMDLSNGWCVGDNGTIIETNDQGATWAASVVPISLGSANFRAIDGFNIPSEQMAVAVGESGKAAKVEVGVSESNKLTETICIDYNQDCSSQDIYLMWLNQFGGWDFWKFTAEKDFNTDITESQRTQKNIYDDWPKSYNRQALREESRISGFKSITVRSQHLTSAQADAIGGIKTSMSVIQIKEGLTLSDNVTVLVDKNSFQRFNETDDLFTMTFTIRQTDDIATQSN